MQVALPYTVEQCRSMASVPSSWSLAEHRGLVLDLMAPAPKPSSSNGQTGVNENGVIWLGVDHHAFAAHLSGEQRWGRWERCVPAVVRTKVLRTCLQLHG